MNFEFDQDHGPRPGPKLDDIISPEDYKVSRNFKSSSSHRTSLGSRSMEDVNQMKVEYVMESRPIIKICIILFDIM